MYLQPIWETRNMGKPMINDKKHRFITTIFEEKT
jgi:hypothetical protein